MAQKPIPCYPGIMACFCYQSPMRLYTLQVAALLCWTASATPRATALPEAPSSGLASWYGEAHRGRLMANGQPFNPDKFTAASWFYPLGTKVRVTNATTANGPSVVVTITDRGPAESLVGSGRIIDLGYAAFRRIAAPELGLIRVSVKGLELCAEPRRAPPGRGRT
jgi:rare lipoprotein A